MILNTTARVAQLHFTAPSAFNSRATSRAVPSLPLSTAAGGQNYLPGPRPIENELGAYFKDDFAWLVF